MIPGAATQIANILFDDEPAEEAPPSPAAQPPGASQLVDRLAAAAQAANRLVAAGTQLRRAAQAKRDAEQALYRAARDAAATGITWPDIHAALGNQTPGEDADLPTPSQLYSRARQLDS